MAAAAAYGSLGITDFRAFKHFAFIGGFGMMACWVATYALLPAVLIAIDRIRPFEAATGRLFGFLRARGTLYASLFAAAVVRAPRAIASVGIALAVVGAALLVSRRRR